MSAYQQAQLEQQQMAALQRQYQQLVRLQQLWWERLFLATAEMSEDELRAALKSPVPAVRFAATYMVGERLLEWPDELIPLLEDKKDEVRQAARRSLVILSFLVLNPEEAKQIRSNNRSVAAKPLSELQRPVDFGPAPRANVPARAEAAKQWRQWWEERSPGAKGSRYDLVATAKPAAKKASEELAEGLQEPNAEKRRERVAEYRDAKGVEYTEALAIASARASGEARQELRQALAERLARMTDRTLGVYLGDPNAEIRRAAALALAARNTRAQFDRLIDLLLDSQPAVQTAAHAALCQLSRQDFGPRINATEAEKQEATTRWRQWWQDNKPPE
jgi:HEAT repeat protein